MRMDVCNPIMLRLRCNYACDETTSLDDSTRLDFHLIEDCSEFNVTWLDGEFFCKSSDTTPRASTRLLFDCEMHLEKGAWTTVVLESGHCG